MATFVRLSFLSCIIGLFTLTVSLPPGLAADDENLTASLIGIRNIYVNVKPIDNPIVTEAGIDESLIKELAEKQLRKAGIQLLSQEEYNRYKMTLRYPLALLELRLTVHEIEGMDAAIAEFRVRVMQVAFLSRKPIVQINAPSWEVQEIGVVRDPSFLEEALKKSLDQFIHDYFSENSP